ncbi:MAG TPA: hypothetical protein VLH38_03925 [Patescibacteria group bacterium]|nr:hypothetical protein [Patescibacteria group bacterium]
MEIWRHKLSWWFAYLATTLVVVCSLGSQLAGAQSSLQAVCSDATAKKSAFCAANGSNALSGPDGILIKVSNIFAFLTGVGAVIGIMVGGFMYITAAGDPNKASTGRSTVIYACVGLVVIVLGRAIIGFVVTKF